MESAADEAGIGRRVRAARERLGWTREALAFHSGISWSGIAQAESGRRKQLQPQTLARLSQALGVSIDYLVAGAASPVMAQHQVLLYDSDALFVEATTSYVRAGVEQSDAVLVVASRRNLGLLRKSLGEDVKSVRLADSKSWYRTPTEALAAYREFLTTSLQEGAAWVRIAGQPTWGGTAAQLRQWTRYESLVNLVFGASPVTLLCLYDQRALGPAIIDHARCTHPWSIEPGGPEGSAEYREPGEFMLEA